MLCGNSGTCYGLYTGMTNQEIALWRLSQNAHFSYAHCVLLSPALFDLARNVREVFFLHIESQMHVEAVLLVTIAWLTQRTSNSWVVLALTLLVTWRLKCIRQLPSATLHLMKHRLKIHQRKGFSIWNITCSLQLVTALCWKCSPHSRATGRDVWRLSRSFRSRSACWAPAAPLSSGKDVRALLRAMPGWVTPRADKQPCLLWPGSLLSALVERFNVWLIAVYIFSFLLMLKTLVRCMWLDAFSRQKC